MAVALAFADPVRDAQAAFRAVMNAMARPGSVQPIASLAGAPAPLGPTAAAIAVALADYETPLWLDPALAAAPDVGAWLTFHTGARIIAEPARAAFALIADGAALADLETFAQGTDIYPDRSTTLILQVASLGAALPTPLPGGERSDAQRPGEGTQTSAHPLSRPSADLSPPGRGAGVAPGLIRLDLAGPGIKGHSHLAVAGLPADIAPRLAANQALFPRGVDLVLAGTEGVAALPRTTRVTVEA